MGYIKQINNLLEQKGSKFRTRDGCTLVMYIGHLTFLKRSFDTPEECFEFVSKIK